MVEKKLRNTRFLTKKCYNFRLISFIFAHFVFMNSCVNEDTVRIMMTLIVKRRRKKRKSLLKIKKYICEIY